MNKKELLKKMMFDLNNQNNLYKPGNYWKFYEKNIVKQILKNKLENFRKWEGGVGIGNIQSFGGGARETVRAFGMNLHPFEEKFLKIDNNFLIKIFNKIINKLSKYIPILSFFYFRIALARNYYFQNLENNFDLLFELIENLDSKLLEVSDSKSGSPLGYYRNNKFYTYRFLTTLLEIYFIKKNSDFSNINNIIELGAGTGLLASAFLKTKKNIKYFIVDIPPALYISEYFLKSLNYKVFGYNDLINQKEENINFNDYQVIFLPSWKMYLLKKNNIDLFINIASFQEMEKEQTSNYLNIILDIEPKYIYLNNAIKGHYQAPKKEQFGVLNPTSMEHCETIIEKQYALNKKEVKDGNYKSLFKKK